MRMIALIALTLSACGPTGEMTCTNEGMFGYGFTDCDGFQRVLEDTIKRLSTVQDCTQVQGCFQYAWSEQEIRASLEGWSLVVREKFDDPKVLGYTWYELGRVEVKRQPYWGHTAIVHELAHVMTHSLDTRIKYEGLPLDCDPAENPNCNNTSHPWWDTRGINKARSHDPFMEILQ